MLPPIRPRPDESDLAQEQHLLDRRGQVAQRRRRVGPRSVTRSAGRPCARSVCRSPIACACLSVVERVAARPGSRRRRARRATSCRKRPGLRAALVELAGRVQEARAVAERRRRLRARRGSRARSSATAASNSADRRDVAHDRDVARRRRRRDRRRRARRRRRRRRRCVRRPRAPRLVVSLASCTLGWSNGLIPSTQPATAVANSAKKKIRPRSLGPAGRAASAPAGRRRRSAATRLVVVVGSSASRRWTKTRSSP